MLEAILLAAVILAAIKVLAGKSVAEKRAEIGERDTFATRMAELDQRAAERKARYHRATGR